MIRDASDSAAAPAALVDVKVIPRAGRTGFAGTRDNLLLVRLAAPPVEGAANTALVDLFARTLDLPKRHITIVSGEKSRTKRVKVIGMSAALVRERLGLAAG